LLSAFFWTYSCCQLLSGWLVDHFDVKWVFAAGIFSVVERDCGHRGGAFAGAAAGGTVVLGLGESVAYPSYSKIMAVHCPEGRRGFANSMIAAGWRWAEFRNAAGRKPGRFVWLWRPFFHRLGLVCLLWLVPWVQWMPTTDNGQLQESEERSRDKRDPAPAVGVGYCICLSA